MVVMVVALTTMMPKLHVAGLVVKQDKDKAPDADYEPLDLSHINPVDLCLFVCHSCFDQVSVNHLIILCCAWQRRRNRGRLPHFLERAQCCLCPHFSVVLN